MRLVTIEIRGWDQVVLLLWRWVVDGLLCGWPGSVLKEVRDPSTGARSRTLCNWSDVRKKPCEHLGLLQSGRFISAFAVMTRISVCVSALLEWDMGQQQIEHSMRSEPRTEGPAVVAIRSAVASSEQSHRFVSPTMHS